MGGWQHRPALDGLRAVALGLVLAFHGGVGLVGGALGVDLFLVLSGYLITGLLLVEHDRAGKVDLPAFWGRRVRRLVPAILVLVAVVGAFGHLELGDAAATLGWWSNWRFALADQGYFDAFGAPSPLRHTWSLAVEEQWYLVWPGLIWLLVARGKGRFLLPVVVVLALASAGAMWLLAGDLDRAHMGTDTRAQGLLVGAAVAIVLHRRALPRTAPATVAGLAGTVVLGAMALRTEGTEPWLYRGGHLLVAVAGAAMLVAALLPRGPIRAVLAVRPLRAIGRLSYGAYLWHWPIYLWLTPDRTGLDRWWLLALRAAVTAGAAAASWHLVERPVLDARPLPRPHLALPTAFAAVAIVVIAAGAVDPAANRPAASSSIAAVRPTIPDGYQPPAAPPTTIPGLLDRPAPTRPITGEPVVTVVGDSQAWALAWEVEPVAAIDVREGTGIGCGIDPARVVINGVPEVRLGAPIPCDQMADLWQWSVAGDDPDLVLLGIGAWEVYDRVLDDGTRLDVGTPAWARWLDGRLEAVAADLAVGAPHALLAIGDVPCFAERDLSLGGPESPRNDPARREAVDDVVQAFVARHPARVTTMPWSRWLCDVDEPPERPDGVHLTGAAARQLWEGALGKWVTSAVR